MHPEKLTNKPEIKSSKDFHVEFSNSKMEKFKATFGTSKARYLVFSFDVTKGSHLKGLALKISKATKLKYFVLRYWYNKKLRRLVLGIFKSGYGIKEVNDKLYQLVKDHTNDKGIWITDPLIAEKEIVKLIDSKKKLVIISEKYI